MCAVRKPVGYVTPGTENFLHGAETYRKRQHINDERMNRQGALITKLKAPNLVQDQCGTWTSEQLKELCRVEGKLTAVMTRESAKSFGRSIGDLLQNGKQVLQGVFDGINESLKTEE